MTARGLARQEDAAALRRFFRPPQRTWWQRVREWLGLDE